MKFIQVKGVNGDEIRLNANHIIMYYKHPDGEGTRFFTTDGDPLRALNEVEEIDNMLAD